MDDTRSWLYRLRGEKTARMLEKHGFEARYIETADEAREYATQQMEQYNPIGFGGSMTISRDLGLSDIARKMGKSVADHGAKGLSPEEKISARRVEQTCGLFLTSTNAVTLTGCLVNIDGTGNRVGAMSFGPEKILVIAGANKITDTVDEGIRRIKQVACPMNARRLGLSTPCATTGFCSDCDSPQRFCNVTQIIERRPTLSPFEVVIVGEELGY